MAIEKNVSEFLYKCSSAAGKHFAENYSFELYEPCTEMQSPIEKLFYCALKTVCTLEYCYDNVVESDENGQFAYGIYIIPQSKIGNFKADFEIHYSTYLDAKKRLEPKKVIVELDGYKFHDKNEKQRRYEKARDRFFQKQGFIVFHYTGSEIVKNPFIPASEVLSFLENTNQEEILNSVAEYYE